MQLNNSFRLEVGSAMHHWYIRVRHARQAKKNKKSPKDEKQKALFHSKEIQLQMDTNTNPFALNFASRSVLKVMLWNDKAFVY